MMKAVSTALLVALIWGLPIYGQIYNQLYPSYESALGVAYAWAIGVGVGMALTPIWALVAQWVPAMRFNPYVVAVAWLGLLFGAIFASGGHLSRF